MLPLGHQLAVITGVDAEQLGHLVKLLGLEIGQGASLVAALAVAAGFPAGLLPVALLAAGREERFLDHGEHQHLVRAVGFGTAVADIHHSS